MSEWTLGLSGDFCEEAASPIREAIGGRSRTGSQQWALEQLRQLPIPPARRQQVEDLVAACYAKGIAPCITDVWPTVLWTGGLTAWLVLFRSATAFATVFSGTLGKNAAEEVWRLLTTKRKQKKQIEPLIDIVEVLTSVVDRDGRPVRICAVLNVPRDGSGTPDENPGAVLWTDSQDALDLARNLAAFIIHAEEISAKLREKRAQGQIESCLIEPKRDGSLTIRWCCGPNAQAYEEHLP